ncbi:MAG TPA: nucleotidyltransferase family protein [Polyangiales bacterium]|nr:nucleotidyltransferase family protein [Polyangiales bacterium]
MAAVSNAMLFSAGLGTRMRPITARIPKALIELGGKPILDYAIERFNEVGCRRLVINGHHHADQLEAHVARTPSEAELVYIHEPVLLETGGTVVSALPLLGPDAFFAVNMDMIWLDTPGSVPALERLRRAFDPERMDALLLLQPMTRTVGYGGRGDFGLNAAGELTREGERPYAYASLQILHPRLFAGRKLETFSLREVWFAPQRPDGSLARIHGLVHEGDWLHVGTPGELAAAEAFLAQRVQ